MKYPYRSAVLGVLPKEFDAVVGGTQLPPGVLVVPRASFASQPVNSASPCLWISRERPDDLAELLKSLVADFHTTGLWPIILQSLSGADDRPWFTGELDPGSSTDPATYDATALLQRWWGGAMQEEGLDDEDDLDTLYVLDPFGRAFPGLAPRTTSTSNRSPISELATDMSGRLGLVSVTCPADVVATIGWQGYVYYPDMGLLSAVLRSWENRFHAFVVAIGFDTLTLAVGRPPSTLNAAQSIAAEHFAVCSDNVYQGSGSISYYANELLDNNRWDFWWD